MLKHTARPRLRFLEEPEAGDQPGAGTTAETDAEVDTNHEEPAKPTEEPKEADPSPEDELPQWAQVEIKRLRAENAARRTANRDLTEKVGSMKSVEEFEQAIADHKAQIAQMELQAAREKAARETGLPDPLVARLSGETAEEILADAKALAEVVGASAQATTPRIEREPSGGLSPERAGDTPFDPVKAAHAAKVRPY